ncbi:hypothetical protein ACO0LO_07665 [Undibacterium sp. TJN25]|uniref:hypothetical protein n=1 Tax=Undibacterium sp. TJN25 TaxID=3413056 RepID=UPI003BF3CB3A
MRPGFKFILLAGLALCTALSAQAAQPAPDLDLVIRYYSRVMSPEGVLNESRYEEKMLRRPAHVWVARVLPKTARQENGDGQAHEHRHFNHVLIPRHVILDHGEAKIEFVDAGEQQVVTIPPAEFENVNFDGSWVNAFYLLDPEQLKALPISTKLSTAAGARWREREKNGVYQRVLWDEKKQIPLRVETGDRAGTFYRRIDVKPLATVSKDLPWLNIKGFAQKEYSDFLD